MMKLLDTNILVYAHGLPHPLKLPCGHNVKVIVKYPDSSAVDTELFQEIAYLYSRRGEHRRAIETITESLKLFPHVFPVTKVDVIVMRDLMQRYPSLPPRDAVHAAIVMNNRLDGIVSADIHFDMVAEIVRVDPVAEAALWPE